MRKIAGAALSVLVADGGAVLVHRNREGGRGSGAKGVAEVVGREAAGWPVACGWSYRRIFRLLRMSAKWVMAQVTIGRQAAAKDKPRSVRW